MYQMIANYKCERPHTHLKRKGVKFVVHTFVVTFGENMIVYFRLKD